MVRQRTPGHQSHTCAQRLAAARNRRTTGPHPTAAPAAESHPPPPPPRFASMALASPSILSPLPTGALPPSPGGGRGGTDIVLGEVGDGTQAMGVRPRPRRAMRTDIAVEGECASCGTAAEPPRPSFGPLAAWSTARRRRGSRRSGGVCGRARLHTARWGDASWPRRHCPQAG